MSCKEVMLFIIRQYSLMCIMKVSQAPWHSGYDVICLADCYRLLITLSFFLYWLYSEPALKVCKQHELQPQNHPKLCTRMN